MAVARWVGLFVSWMYGPLNERYTWLLIACHLDAFLLNGLGHQSAFWAALGLYILTVIVRDVTARPSRHAG